MTPRRRLLPAALVLTMLLSPGCRGARIDAELVEFVNAGAVPTSASTSGKGVLLDSPAAVSEFTGGKGNVCVAASQLAAVFAVNRSDMTGKR